MTRKNEIITYLNKEWSKANTLTTLIDCWEKGYTVEATAAEVGVSTVSICKWLNAYPELKELRDICRSKMNTMARRNIHKALSKGSIDVSKWYLEKTDPEFKKNPELSAVQVNIVTVEDREKELRKFMERFGQDAGVIDTVVTEERELSGVDTGEDTGALQESERIPAETA